MKNIKLGMLYSLLLLSISTFSQSREYNKRFSLEDKEISISKNKTRYLNSFSRFQKNKYLELKIISNDSITKSDIEEFDLVLLDSQYNQVRPYYITGQRNVFSESDWKKKSHVNTDKVAKESATQIYDNYALVKFTLRKRIIDTYSSLRESKHLSKGTYFLVVKYKNISVDTVSLNIR